MFSARLRFHGGCGKYGSCPCGPGDRPLIAGRCSTMCAPETPPGRLSHDGAQVWVRSAQLPSWRVPSLNELIKCDQGSAKGCWRSPPLIRRQPHTNLFSSWRKIKVLAVDTRVAMACKALLFGQPRPMHSRAAATNGHRRPPSAEIAASTGFADQSHLSRWVRRVHGISPTRLAA
jgi:AraC-like DNA-binding protein